MAAVTEIKEFKQIISVHIEHLLDNEEIESSCAVSSQLLGSYFQRQGWKIIYGTYSQHNYFHSWIETPEGILDPTRFQFITNKKEINYYKDSESTPFIEFILSVQEHWLFDVTDPCYKKIAEISPLFLTIDGNYKEFLEKVRNLDSYKTINWRHSMLLKEPMNFTSFLNSRDKRIGKKHFRRYSVCNA